MGKSEPMLIANVSGNNRLTGPLQYRESKEKRQDITPRGSTVVVLLPDRGDRYLSTEAFRSVCAICPP